MIALRRPGRCKRHALRRLAERFNIQNAEPMKSNKTDETAIHAFVPASQKGMMSTVISEEMKVTSTVDSTVHRLLR
jgi:hypothetical protein